MLEKTAKKRDVKKVLVIRLLGVVFSQQVRTFADP